jgi:Flp pilus assembly protein TadD
MALLGRNDPCRCGSGKKYKRCCESTDRAAELAARRAVQEEALARAQAEKDEILLLSEAWTLRQQIALEDDAFIEESNAIVELIHAGQLDEAESRARALIDKVPEHPDGLERLGHVYEARGDLKTAASLYREAIALVLGQGMPYDDHLVWLRELADRLDPPIAA